MSYIIEQVIADKVRMERYICERIPAEHSIRIDLALGVWADLFSTWDDYFGWDLQVETNEPEWVDIWELYEHIRVQEMTWMEWSREIDGRLARWNHGLEREMSVLREERNKASATADQDRVEALSTVDEHGLPREVSTGEAVRILCLLDQKLDRITNFLVQQKTVKEWYTTAEVGQRLGRAEFTVREWCRLGQCQAEKKKPYRGGQKQWMIPHDELLKLESDGPAALKTFHR